MKRDKVSLVAAITLGSLLAVGSLTQAQEKKETKPEPKTEVKPAPQPASRLDRSQRMAEMLKLSDEQKVKFKPVLDEETQKLKELGQDPKLTREDRMAKYKEIREATNAKVKPILNPEQTAQWDKMHGSGPRIQPRVQPAAQPPAQPQPKDPATK
jgi:hypothetical protein